MHIRTLSKTLMNESSLLSRQASLGEGTASIQILILTPAHDPSPTLLKDFVEENPPPARRV